MGIDSVMVWQKPCRANAPYVSSSIYITYLAHFSNPSTKNKKKPTLEKISHIFPKTNFFLYFGTDADQV